jgi:hypothetical protein
VGEQVVAEIDRAEPGMTRAMGGQPALGGAHLAVLLLRPVLLRRSHNFLAEIGGL